MSQATYSRGRFQGRGRSGGRDGGRSSQRNPGRYDAAQAARIPVKSSKDDEILVFDIQPNRVDTAKFVAAQRKRVDYVSTRYPDVGKIFCTRTRSSIHILGDLSHLRQEKQVDMIMKETSLKKK